MKILPLFNFIFERYNIYKRRQRGEPKPWTADPILQRYRFCNVYRELDTVTAWISEHWRMPNEVDIDLWFAMAVARLINYPPSLEAVGYPIPWNELRFRKILKERKLSGEQVFNGAYMIHASKFRSPYKTDYLGIRVLTPMWKARGDIRPREADTLANFHNRLTKHRDMGSFMAAQIVADTKFVGLLANAKDWFTWAAPGPGSQRGLNRVLGKPVGEHWPTAAQWLKQLNKLQEKINHRVLDAVMSPLSAQDLQNCLCEFDKYERARLGEGRPKALYPGLPGPYTSV